jgi:hypothetical protein
MKGVISYYNFVYIHAVTTVNNYKSFTLKKGEICSIATFVINTVRGVIIHTTRS